MKQFILFCITIFTALPVLSQNNSDNTQAEQIALMVKQQEFRIRVTSTNTERSSSISFYSNLHLSLADEYVTALLPYAGSTNSSLDEGGSIINLKSGISDYTAKALKRSAGWEVSFKATTINNEVFSFNVKIYNNGNCQIKMSSSHRTAATYEGQLSFSRA